MITFLIWIGHGRLNISITNHIIWLFLLETHPTSVSLHLNISYEPITSRLPCTIDNMTCLRSARIVQLVLGIRVKVCRCLSLLTLVSVSPPWKFLLIFVQSVLGIHKAHVRDVVCTAIIEYDSIAIGVPRSSFILLGFELLALIVIFNLGCNIGGWGCTPLLNVVGDENLTTIYEAFRDDNVVFRRSGRRFLESSPSSLHSGLPLW